MSTRAGERVEYDEDFYRAQSGRSLTSARKMLSYLFEHYLPAKVVDVGCGTGAWLAAARELGTGEILGLDGAHVNAGSLRIPREDFTAADLERPLEVPADADLCICVEVAEHLSKDRAASLVHDLTSCAPLVLFGAAAPGQAGANHVNLQWPSYWRGLFEQAGYVAVDCMRIPFWDDADVDSWYAQNTLLYCDRTRADIRQSLSAMPSLDPPGLPLVHPDLYHGYVYEFESGSARSKYRQLWHAIERAVRRRLGLRARGPEGTAPPVRGMKTPPDQDG